MKQLFLFAICFSGFVVYGKSQQKSMLTDTIKVILENDKVKVTEYSSAPGKDICGKGRHTHPPHLSIFLTDAGARLVMPDGKTQDFNLKAGHALWSEAETHMVVNNGNKPAKVYIIELK